MARRLSTQVGLHQISPLWSVTRGAGVRVAVLDSGTVCSDGLPEGRVDVVSSTGLAPAPISDPHGTYCASVIGSEQRKAEGIAPEVSILSVQVGITEGAISARKVADGLELALERECDLISCSFVLPDLGQEAERIRQALRRAHMTGVPVVAAAGNDPAQALEFPDMFPHALVVSALDVSFDPLDVRRNEWTDVHALGEDLDVVNTDGVTAEWRGLTSGATAIVSGVLALSLAAVSKQKRRRIGMSLESLAKSTAIQSSGSAGQLLRINPERLINAALSL